MIARISLILVLLASCKRSQEPQSEPPAISTNPELAPNAPLDQPVHASNVEELAEQKRAIAPYIEQGRKTYPDAKRRYLAGLPPGHHFFVTTSLHSAGAEESVFIAVTKIEGDQITGTIASDILTAKGFKTGQIYTLSEAGLTDWLIAKPDGSEEGNVVGKFLDEWGAKHRAIRDR